jgi:hypothetical protein
MCTPYQDEYTPLAAESFYEKARYVQEGWIRQELIAFEYAAGRATDGQKAGEPPSRSVDGG